MSHLFLLLRKELLLLRNTHFRTRKQAAIFLGLVVLLLLVTGALAKASLAWFRPLVSELPPDVAAAVFQPLVLMVYAWLTMLFLFSTMQESRSRFFLTPDLGLLVATPVNPFILFTLRFFMFTCFNASGFAQLSIFGFAPLIALGVLDSAPWYYYALLLPVTCVYLIIPAALGVTLIMLLMRLLSPKRLFQAAAVFNGFLGILWFIFIFGDRETILARLVAAMEGAAPVVRLLFPLRAVADFWSGLLGFNAHPGTSLLILLASVAAVLAVAMMVIHRVYYYNYERLQVAESIRARAGGKQKEGTAALSRLGRSPLLLLVVYQWKAAVRNREMGQGAFGIIILLIGYVFVMSGFFNGGEFFLPLVMLINTAVVCFFAVLAVNLFFIPFALATDQYVLRRQYWLFKAAPVEADLVSRSLFLAHCIPALLPVLAVLCLANYFTGVPGSLMLLSLGLGTAVTVSLAALFQLTNLIAAGSLGETVPLAARIVREVFPVVYGALVLLPLAVGFYYRELDFLRFLHALPREGVVFLAALLSLLLALAVLRESLRRMRAEWTRMEIR